MTNNFPTALMVAIAMSLACVPAHAEDYETCSGILQSGQTGLSIGFFENGEQVEGACSLPAKEKQRILGACKLNQPCTVIGRQDHKVHPDVMNITQIVSVFAGGIKN